MCPDLEMTFSDGVIIASSMRSVRMRVLARDELAHVGPFGGGKCESEPSEAAAADVNSQAAIGKGGKSE